MDGPSAAIIATQVATIAGIAIGFGVQLYREKRNRAWDLQDRTQAREGAIRHAEDQTMRLSDEIRVSNDHADAARDEANHANTKIDTVNQHIRSLLHREEARSAKRLRVLHVENDPISVKLTALVLMDAYMDVRSVHTESEMNAVLTTWVPDIILMDLRMPGFSGSDTTKRLHSDSRFCKVPIVICSAYAFPEMDVANIGAVGVIPKPIDVLTFADTVRQFAVPTNGGPS